MFMVFGLGIFLLLMDRIMHAAGEDTGRLMTVLRLLGTARKTI